MKKTTITLEITHKKPLPDKVPLADVIACRAHMYLYANGCEAGVFAKVEKTEAAEPEDANARP